MVAKRQSNSQQILSGIVSLNTRALLIYEIEELTYSLNHVPEVRNEVHQPSSSKSYDYQGCNHNHNRPSLDIP